MRAILVTVAALFAISAHAQTAPDPGPGRSASAAFAALDKNSDGSLSRAEAAGEKELAKRFAKFDANKDNKLSEDEYLKAMQDNDKRVLADSAITTKIKAQLLFAKGVPSTAISVTTYEGRVQLSGFVDSEESIAAAGKIARSISGVRAVQNDLKLK